MTLPPQTLEPARRGPTRRHWLWLAAAAGAVAVGGGAAGLAAAAGPAPRPRSDHFPFGALSRPRHLQAFALRTHEGRSTDLASLLGGRTTALQLMFTGCSATCPIQGALFAQAQRQLAGRPAAAQFISLSIDPLSDTPAALAAWLQRFGAGPGWVAASPKLSDVAALVRQLTEEGEALAPGGDAHSGQVMLIDRAGDLVYRTPSFPPAAQIVELLRRVDARA